MQVYLDNNSTTMCDTQVVEAMQPFFSQMYGNPNSPHLFGKATHSALQEALKKIQTALNSSLHDDIVFTSSSVESNNLILKSIWQELIINGDKNHILTTEVEHPSILETCKFLETQGVKVTYLPVNDEGIISVSMVRNFITDKTALVSIMWASHESGMLFPIEEIGAICKQKGVLFHSDASWAIGKTAIDLQNVHVDFLSFCGDKFHGPQGIGGLYSKNGRKISPLLHGLTQPTIQTPSIVGMAKALELATTNLQEKIASMRTKRDTLENALLEIEDTFVVGRKEHRLANTILISIKGVASEAIIWDLSRFGIGVCKTSIFLNEEREETTLLGSIGQESTLAHTGICLSLSRFTTDDEITYTITHFKNAVARLRAISSSYALQQPTK